MTESLRLLIGALLTSLGHTVALVWAAHGGYAAQLSLVGM